MHTSHAVLATVAATLLASGVACERSGEFTNAPSASAPEEPLVTRGSARQQSRDRSRGQVPPGHPPVEGDQAARSSGSKAPPSGGGGGGLPVDWETPESWESVQPSSQMRKAQYRVPGADGEEDATLAVFHFPSGGGGVQQNIDRWAGQFDAPSGSAEPKTETRTVEGLKVHRVELEGTYQPGVGMGSGEPKKNQRMLAAIVETDPGIVVFKLVGPAATVGAARDGFDQLLSSLAPSN